MTSKSDQPLVVPNGKNLKEPIKYPAFITAYVMSLIIMVGIGAFSKADAVLTAENEVDLDMFYSFVQPNVYVVALVITGFLMLVVNTFRRLRTVGFHVNPALVFVSLIAGAIMPVIVAVAWLAIATVLLVWKVRHELV